MSTLEKPLIPVCEDAQQINRTITAQLREINSRPYESCLALDFRRDFGRVLDLIEQYQRAVLKADGRKKSCSAGCNHCCSHWVEDVNSYEAEIIAEYIRGHLAASVDTIVRKCTNDMDLLESLYELVNEKLANLTPGERAGEPLDDVELLLSSFFHMKRPCPLLAADGLCGVYEVRPLTCRIYMSFADPERCSPDYINDTDIPTYLLDLDDEANDLLDQLHFRFLRFEGDAGLRSLLVKYLSQPIRR